MSDDTPTRVLPTDAPTTPLSPPSFASGPTRPRPKPPSRAPFIAFIVLAVLLVAAVIVLADILITRADAPAALPTTMPTASIPAPSPTASSTPGSSPSPTPVVVAPAGAFTSFSAATTAQCGFHGRRHAGAGVQVTWSTANATQVWVAAGASDAVGAGEQVPLAGDQSSFGTPLELQCTAQPQQFTMTLVGADGAHVSRTWTVTVQLHRR